MQRRLDEDELDAVFAALAHQGRRAALRHIADGDRGSLAMNQLAEATGMSPQALQKHLVSLERAGLIERSREGRVTHAVAQPEVLAAAGDWIADMSAYWNNQLDSLSDYIATLGRRAEDKES
ncbi:ArsR family transcriptional regulator [Knoellia sinensis KCTC 19936]|uniref:ArsR family transcriptional regulator n=1 Tax=Knoellia sinensis KCTC 19936 TaxID=1385520 RepID=A0A0A0J222_9MICO|nr:ArsR family transcriptional regulator [Knoellia sinensis KCTC 19936]